VTNQNALVGSTLAGYHIDELIGRGGMGEVYRALDVRLGRPVALKLLVDALGEDERFQERMLRESRLAASLDHPNVVPIYEAGEAAGRLFIAMRYVQGTDLKALLRREGALEPRRVMAIATQVADALDAAHRRGLVHRDVKPSNVLLDQDDAREHPYLADFGLTQSASDHGPTDGQGMGSVDYVAPEQIRGDESDGRADQYGLGCLLFECLTGSVPYRHSSEVAVIFAHLEEPAPAASERRARLPVDLDPVLNRAMAKDPDERFASCGALVAAAAEALGVIETGPPVRTRRAPLVLAAAILVLAAIAAVVVLAMGGGGAAAPAPAGALVRLDPRTNAVAGRKKVPGHPGTLAVTRGGVWMADFRDGVLWRYEPGGRALRRVTSSGEPRDLAVLGDKVYVGADGRFLSGIVSRYDADTGVREDGIDLLACAMAAGEGVVWAAGCPAVQRLSTGSGRLRKLVEVFLPFQDSLTVENSRLQFRELAVGAGSLWVLGDALDRRLWRLDARDGEVQAIIPLRFAPRSVAVAEGVVWITDAVNDAVVPVDIATNRAWAPIAVGRGASGIAAGGGDVWVANTLGGTVSRIDPRARRLAATIRVGGHPREVAVGGGAVWVTSHAP